MPNVFKMQDIKTQIEQNRKHCEHWNVILISLSFSSLNKYSTLKRNLPWFCVWCSRRRFIFLWDEAVGVQTTSMKWKQAQTASGGLVDSCVRLQSGMKVLDKCLMHLWFGVTISITFPLLFSRWRLFNHSANCEIQHDFNMLKNGVRMQNKFQPNCYLISLTDGAMLQRTLSSFLKCVWQLKNLIAQVPRLLIKNAS